MMKRAFFALVFACTVLCAPSYRINENASIVIRHISVPCDVSGVPQGMSVTYDVVMSESRYKANPVMISQDTLLQVLNTPIAALGVSGTNRVADVVVSLIDTIARTMNPALSGSFASCIPVVVTNVPR